MVVDYVRLWRKKLFCTCPHIKRELKLDCSVTTIARTLNRLLFLFCFCLAPPSFCKSFPNRHDYHWRQVSHKSPLSVEHLQKRKEFVEKHLHHRPAWWVGNMHLVFDGVTLTKAPKKLSSRQKHAAQSIKAIWMKKSEVMDPDLHTHNRHSLFAVQANLATMFVFGLVLFLMMT